MHILSLPVFLCVLRLCATAHAPPCRRLGTGLLPGLLVVVVAEAKCLRFTAFFGNQECVQGWGRSWPPKTVFGSCQLTGPHCAHCAAILDLVLGHCRGLFSSWLGSAAVPLTHRVSPTCVLFGSYS